MSWLKSVIKGIQTVVSGPLKSPDNIWAKKCQGCQNSPLIEKLKENLYVCNRELYTSEGSPKVECGYHYPINARERLHQLLDEGTQEELAQEVVAIDWIKFKDKVKYKDRIAQNIKKTQENEALIVAKGQIYTIPVVVAVFEFGFIGGSMGTAVGTRFVRGVEAAIALGVPFICVSASGGARMQEGLFSLFQMARTSAVLAKLKQRGCPFISVLTDPTMGGVTASLASLGDIIIAEPKARIGLSGPRVIEKILSKVVFPENFQRSEFLLAHGAIDMIVDRRELKSKIAGLLSKLKKSQPRVYSLTAIK